MPAQSCLLPLQKYSSLNIVPSVAKHHPIALCYIFKNLPLTMTLKDHHFYSIFIKNVLFSLDFQLSTGLWFILEDISPKIQLAANPLLNPIDDLPGTIDPDLIDWISMPSPVILAIKNYMQILLSITSNCMKLQHRVYHGYTTGFSTPYTCKHCTRICAASHETCGILIIKIIIAITLQYVK